MTGQNGILLLLSVATERFGEIVGDESAWFELTSDRIDDLVRPIAHQDHGLDGGPIGEQLVQGSSSELGWLEIVLGHGHTVAIIVLEIDESCGSGLLISRSTARASVTGLVLLLLDQLTDDRLQDEHEQMFATRIGLGRQVGVGQQLFEQNIASRLAPLHQGFALALFPTITIGSGRCLLQLAIVAPMTNSSTLRATTERPDQAASATLENVLIDVLLARPGERARIVGAEHVEWRVVWQRRGWVEHLHECLMSIAVRFVLHGHVVHDGEQLIGGRVRPIGNGVHEGRVPVEVTRRQKGEQMRLDRR